MKRFVVTALLLLLLPACSHVGFQDLDSPNPMREMMVRAEMKALAGKIQNEWDSGLMDKAKESGEKTESGERPARAISPETIKDGEIAKRLAQAFDVEEFADLLSRSVNESMTERDWQRIDHWYSSPLGRKVLALEKSGEGESYTEQDVREALEVWGKPKARAELVRQFLEADGRTKFYNSVMDNLLKALVSAIAMELGRDDLPLEDIRELFQEEMDPLIQDMIDDGFNRTAIAVKGLSDQEIYHYIRFTKTREVRKLHEALYRGLTQGFMETGARAGKAIVKIIGQEVAFRERASAAG